VAEPNEVVALPFVCDFCGRAFSKRQGLASHMRVHKLESGPKIVVRKRTLIELLGAVGEWLEEDSQGKEVPAAILATFREQDVKIRLALHLLAMTRVQRLPRLNTLLRQVDEEIARRIGDPDEMELLKPKDIIALQERLEQAIEADVEMIAVAVDSTKGQGVTALAQRLELLLRELGADQTPLAGGPPALPPTDRESIRRVLVYLQETTSGVRPYNP